jgi:class 3 adenylate cyclase
MRVFELNAAKEARLWQVAGGVLTLFGALLMVGFLRYGTQGSGSLLTATGAALNVGISATFLLLVGLTTISAGRAMGVADRPLGPWESRLWAGLTLLCLSLCVAIVVVAQFLHGAPAVSRILIGFSVMAAVLFRMAHRLSLAQQEIVEQKREIEKQQQLAESLLLNTLPAEIAAELKQKGAVDPRYHEDVTILFTDFQGFTVSTEKLSADQLVKALHQYFTAFDAIMGRHGLEKLKTIGDSYMCVGGLPERRASHAVDAVLAAFEIVDEVIAGHAHGLPPWNVRVGVHTGPVISGVVGVRKFAYDIWGESVNFASRMESAGRPNRINLSASTYARVKDFFACEYRGKVATKEGREYDMYFAVGLAASLSTGKDPEQAFRERYRSYFQRDLNASLPATLTASATPAPQRS